MRFRLFKYAVLPVLTLSVFFLYRCKKEVSDNTYFGSKVIILGHKGMSSNYMKAPGDTYETIRNSLGMGADGCEVDVQITKDTVLVLFHDGTLNLTTTCSGKVYDQTWDDLRQCKYYAFENNIFINSVDSDFKKISNLTNYYFSFDCKIDDEVVDMDLYEAQFIRAIDRVCKKYNMSKNVFMEGPIGFLKKAKAMGIENKLFLIGELSEANIDSASTNGFFGLSSDQRYLLESTEVAHNKGLRVMVYTPKTFYENKKVLEAKPDIIQTDDPISILKYLNRYDYEYIIP